MAESESGGPKKPGKRASPAAKPPKPAAKKPAKASAKPAAKKPARVTSATAKGAASATKKRATRSPKPAKAASPAKKARPSAPKVTTAAKPATPVAAAKPAAPAAAAKPAESAAAPAKPAEPVTAVKPPAAAPKDAPSRAPAKRTVVKATARAYFEALAARDAEAAVGTWDAEGVDDLVPLGIFRGPAAIRTLLKELFTAVPDARFTVERITADDRVAAVQWRLAGTFRGGTFQGLEPTGRRVDLRGVDCLEIVDGKIVHNTSMFDGAAYARQVGLLPAEDSGADRAIRAGFNTVTRLRRTMAKRTAR